VNKKKRQLQQALFLTPLSGLINFNRDFGQPQGLPLLSKMIAIFSDIQVA
jgi:hypothetical protein